MKDYNEKEKEMENQGKLQQPIKMEEPENLKSPDCYLGANSIC